MEKIEIGYLDKEELRRIVKEVKKLVKDIDTLDEMEDVLIDAGLEWVDNCDNDSIAFTLGEYREKITNMMIGKEDYPINELVKKYDVWLEIDIDDENINILTSMLIEYKDRYENYQDATITLIKGKVKIKEHKGYKEIGGCKYTHKSNINTLTGLGLLEVQKVLPKDFTYDILKLDLKNNTITLVSSPDFDTAREPIVADAYKIDCNTGEIKFIKGKGQIYHHKWMFVKPDYEGFDIKESKRWSRE